MGSVGTRGLRTRTWEEKLGVPTTTMENPEKEMTLEIEAAIRTEISCTKVVENSLKDAPQWQPHYPTSPPRPRWRTTT